MNLLAILRSQLLLLLFCLSLHTLAQQHDTLSNWDGITQNWQVYAGASAVVNNPHPDSINPSNLCFRITSTADEYDLFYYDLPEPVNFDAFGKYGISVYAPSTGGDVVIKFENSTVSDWEEIRKTPTPGKWSRLEFDFTGRHFNNFTRMVIFFDFLGSTVGKNWFFDDIWRDQGEPLALRSNLPILVINTNGAPIQNEPKIMAKLGVIANDSGRMNILGQPFNNYDGFIGIEIRGQSSQDFPKKSYAFETRDSLGTNRDVSLLGLPEENDWVLYAPYSDKSLLRNTLSYEMARKMSGYHTRSRFCEVVLNGDYRGIYVLEEKIKKDEHRVDIATLKPEDIAGDDLTGGYILRVDKTFFGYNSNTDGWTCTPVPAYPNSQSIIWQYYHPDASTIVAAQKNYIHTFIQSVSNSLTGNGFKDPNGGYQRYIDVASFVDILLLAEFSKEVDKYRYSTYFYKDKDSKGGKLHAGPAWDFDLGYGNVDYWWPGIDVTGWVYKLIYSWDTRMFFWKRMMEDTYFQNLAKTRWEKLRSEKWSDDAINNVIDSLVTLTDSARVRNFERWPILGEYVWPNYNWENNDYADELRNFKNFLFSRVHWIDNNLPGQILHPWAELSGSGRKIRITLFGDYFRSTILDPDRFTFQNAPPGITITALDYINASECAMALSLDVSNCPNMTVTIDKKVLNTYEDIVTKRLSAAGIESIHLDEMVQVSCRDGQLHIISDHPENLPDKLSLYSITGRFCGDVHVERVHENSYSLNLESGVYLLQFQIDHQSLTKKIIWIVQ